jgi:hypothetical protein
MSVAPYELFPLTMTIARRAAVLDPTEAKNA